MTVPARSLHGKKSASATPKSMPSPEYAPTPIGRASRKGRACSTLSRKTGLTAEAILSNVARIADYRGIALPLDAASHELSQGVGTSGIANQALTHLLEATTSALALSARLSMDPSTSPLVSGTFRSHALGLLATCQKYRADLQMLGVRVSEPE